MHHFKDITPKIFWSAHHHRIEKLLKLSVSIRFGYS